MMKVKFSLEQKCFQIKDRNMNRALVTGSKGYIGKFLVQELVRMGWEVIEFDKADNPLHDINFTTLEKVFEEQEFSVVFHLAAVSKVRQCEMNLQNTYATNTLSTIRLDNLCQRYGKKMIFISSVAVDSEEKTTYSMSKEVAEFHLTKSSNAVIVRLPNVIGAYPGFEFKEDCSLFENLILNIKTNKPLTIYGNAWRDWVDIQSVLWWISDSLNATLGTIITVPGSIRCSVKRLMEGLERFTNHKFEYTEEGAIDPQNYRKDEKEVKFNYTILEKVIDSYK